MNNSLYIFLFVCSVLLGSCGRVGERPNLSPEGKAHLMIQVENYEVTKKTLTLDYRIRNPFADGIWVCYDISVHGEQGTQNTATRIDGKAVRIKLCFNLERSGAFENPTGVAKYIRLLPGEAFAGRIVQDLPIEGHVHGWQAERKKHKEIILQRAIFEIGYFGPELNRFFDSLSEEIKKNPDKSKPVITPGPFYYLQFNPFITEERLDGILREVMYIDENAPLIEEEKSVETIITDVNIPCSVVVEEKLGETKKLGTVTHLFLDMG